jgi:hypothetical protein
MGGSICQQTEASQLQELTVPKCSHALLFPNPASCNSLWADLVCIFIVKEILLLIQSLSALWFAAGSPWQFHLQSHVKKTTANVNR